MRPFRGDHPLKEFDGEKLTLDNLSKLNKFGNHGKDIFLTANDDPATYPPWLQGKPISHKGDSAAKTPIIFVRKTVPDKNGEPVSTVDMFSFYFFNFNAGPRLPHNRQEFFGDHVGDLEHSMVRFQGGEPILVYLSRHASGNLYPYDALEKIGRRVRDLAAAYYLT